MARTRILVVDDEPDILELVQYNLAKRSMTLWALHPAKRRWCRCALHLLTSSCWT